jgi:hypothetical protein
LRFWRATVGVRCWSFGREASTRFKGLAPSALGKAEMQVSWDGTVRVGRRAAPSGSRGAVSRGIAAREAAGDLAVVLPSVFQGERKSAVLELRPLRYDAVRGQLLLTKRLRVRLLFTGREAGESGRGSVGRAPVKPEPVLSGEVLARLHDVVRVPVDDEGREIKTQPA